ncbi:hypothetical protein A1353_09510 [Methylomonas methanica]|uniref:Uncharacterized protein n=1 Tax=Methylomonas methanica TaxID=421 RepID=A0A177MMY8_METMH|nr:hypothetical protein [Methylomonas methanica]OAI06239.1 hypothetical protein A1353_09510 [Methylomonas methanica]
MLIRKLPKLNALRILKIVISAYPPVHKGLGSLPKPRRMDSLKLAEQDRLCAERLRLFVGHCHKTVKITYTAFSVFTHGDWI